MRGAFSCAQYKEVYQREERMDLSLGQIFSYYRFATQHGQLTNQQPFPFGLVAQVKQ